MEALLSARPQNGFVLPASPQITFESYCAEQIYWHFARALAEDEEPLEPWCRHPDKIIRVNLARAMGPERLTELSKLRESHGNLIGAALASWIAYFHGGEREWKEGPNIECCTAA